VPTDYYTLPFSKPHLKQGETVTSCMAPPLGFKTLENNPDISADLIDLKLQPLDKGAIFSQFKKTGQHSTEDSMFGDICRR
jgi:pyruvate/2-oxoglutarate/acetoin dehydrogenase E1 component